MHRRFAYGPVRSVLLLHPALPVIRGKAVIIIDHKSDFDTFQKYISSALLAHIIKSFGSRVSISILCECISRSQSTIR